MKQLFFLILFITAMVVGAAELEISREGYAVEESEPEIQRGKRDDGGLIKATVNRAKIIGGLPSIPSAWPWMAALFSNGKFICGGTIVAKRWILTAAHCPKYPEYPSIYKVRVGTVDLTQAVVRSREYQVEKVVQHPDFDPDERVNDISLFYLTKNITYQADIQPANLGFDLSSPADGEKCTSIGYGFTSYGMGSAAAMKLREVELPIVNNKKCQDNWSIWSQGTRKIFDSEVCAGWGGDKSPCIGDSGGPLLCRSGSGWKVDGITSFLSLTCTQSNIPAVYTRVASHFDWIKKKIGFLGYLG